MSDDVRTELEDGVLTVTFDRDARSNALTWEMYDGLVAACERADDDDAVRVLVIRGATGKAFAAGTDIEQFRAFTSGRDGVEYERRVTEVLNRIRSASVPTIAAIDGACVGGGFAIACAADLRIAAPAARFGVPIARTLGNCLSAGTLQLLVDVLGRGITLDLMMTARLIDAAEAARIPGFLHRVVDDLTDEVAHLTTLLRSSAPLTIWATKSLIGSSIGHDDSDVLDRVYGSADFGSAVANFGSRQDPRWTGC